MKTTFDKLAVTDFFQTFNTDGSSAGTLYQKVADDLARDYKGRGYTMKTTAVRRVFGTNEFPRPEQREFFVGVFTGAENQFDRDFPIRLHAKGLDTVHLSRKEVLQIVRSLVGALE